MPNITIVNATGGGNNTASTSLVVNVPAGTQNGDVMFLGAVVGNVAGTCTHASWGAITNVAFGSSMLISMYRNVTATAEPASYTFTTSNHVSAALICLVRGLNVVQTLISLQNAANAASTTVTGNAVTSTAPDQLNFWIGATDTHTGANDIVPPTALTEIFQQTNGVSPNVRTICMGYQIKPSVGATGTTERNGTCAVSDANAVTNWIAQYAQQNAGLIMSM